MSPLVSDTSSTLTGPFTSNTMRRVSFSMSSGVIAPSSAKILGFVVTPEQIPHSQYFWISAYRDESTKMATGCLLSMTGELGRRGRPVRHTGQAGREDHVEGIVQGLDPGVRVRAPLAQERRHLD